MYKLLQSPVTANIAAIAACVLSVFVFFTSRQDRAVDKADVMVFSRDDVRDKHVFLKLESDGEVRISTPVRFVVTNRSPIAHPLTELYLTGEETQFVQIVTDKNGQEERLPIRIEPNTARIVEFYARLPINQDAAKALCEARGVAFPSVEEPSVEVCLFGDLWDSVFNLDDKNKLAFYKLSQRANLAFHFATIASGEPYIVEDTVSIP